MSGKEAFSKLKADYPKVEKNSANNLYKEVLNNAKIFEDYSDSFERYRKYFKKHKDIFNMKNIEQHKINSWKLKKESFKKDLGMFNKELENFVKSLDEIFDKREESELKLLFFIQLAQTNAARVQNRLYNIEIERRVEEIQTLNCKVQKQQKNLKDVYTGFISIIGIFLTIFTLVSANLNFFGNIIKNEDLSISKISGIFLLVNAVAIISISALILLLFASIRYFNETQEFKEKRWLCIFIVPLVLMGLALLLIA